MTARSPTSAPGTQDWRWTRPSLARDHALAAFSEGVDAALTAAQAALAAANAEKEEVAAGFASLEREIDARKKRIDAALSGARTNAAQAADGSRDGARRVNDGQDQPRVGTRSTHRVAKTARRREYGGGRNHGSRRRPSLTRPCPSLIGSSATTRSAPPGTLRPASEWILKESSARSCGRMALSNRLAARWPASGCAMRPRLSNWRRGKKGKSRQSMRPGDCCSNR